MLNGPYLTERLRAMPSLPPGTPWITRLSYHAIRLLAFHNRLDGLMSFVGVWWASWTLIFHDFWEAWPVTAQVTAFTGGHPNILAYGLLLSSLFGYLGKLRHINWMRTVAFLGAFACWATLTVVFLTVKPVFSPGVACYSAFALAKLLAYVNFQIGIDVFPNNQSLVMPVQEGCHPRDRDVQ